MLCTKQCLSLVFHGLACAHLHICKQLRRGWPLLVTHSWSDDVTLSVSTSVSSVMRPSKIWSFTYCESNLHSLLKYFMCFISLSPRNSSDNNLKRPSHVFKSFIPIADLWVYQSGSLTYIPTCLLTPWSRVLLEKLTSSKLVKKFPAFYGTQRLITTFTSARHLSLSWARLVHSMTPLPEEPS